MFFSVYLIVSFFNLISHIIKIIAHSNSVRYHCIAIITEMVHSHVTQARTGKSCAFRMQGGKISHVYLLPDMHPVNEIFYGMISLYNRRKAMR